MRGLKNAALVSGIAVIAAMTSRAQATTIYWADLTSDTSSSVSGTITSPSGSVGVTYSGGYAFDQLNNTGTNYWSPTGYTEGLVNAPSTSDIVAFSAAGTGTLTFSHPVTNVYVAFNSWNGAQVTFSSPFTIVSQGCGYWGCGSFVPNADSTGFTGNGETVGVLEFAGVISSLTITDTTSEYWHGATVGVADVSAVPLPAALPMFGAALAGVTALGAKRRRASVTL